jgi:type II secretory pathway component GspD/PulD (secretin)
MVTIEARFIDIQDNFLEQIGVDLINQPKNPNLPPGPNPLDSFGQIDRPRSASTGPGDVQVGYNFINNKGDYNQRAGMLNLLSQPVSNGASNPFNISPSGGMALQWNYLNDYQLQAIVNAVKKKQKARQIHAPRITAFNGQRSHIMSIRQRAYIEDADVNNTGVIPVLNPVIGILNSGTILEVQPTVSHDRRYVTLEIKPTLAIELPSRNVPPLILNSANTQIQIELPVITVQKIRSTVTVPDGGTVLIGGLKNYEERESESGVPFAMKIPVLKNLFRRFGYSQLKRSLVVLVKTNITVIRDEEAQRFGRGK